MKPACVCVCPFALISTQRKGSCHDGTVRTARSRLKVKNRRRRADSERETKWKSEKERAGRDKGPGNMAVSMFPAILEIKQLSGTSALTYTNKSLSNAQQRCPQTSPWHRGSSTAGARLIREKKRIREWRRNSPPTHTQRLQAPDF